MRKLPAASSCECVFKKAAVFKKPAVAGFPELAEEDLQGDKESLSEPAEAPEVEQQEEEVGQPEAEEESPIDEGDFFPA